LDVPVAAAFFATLAGDETSKQIKKNSSRADARDVAGAFAQGPGERDAAGVTDKPQAEP